MGEAVPRLAPVEPEPPQRGSLKSVCRISFAPILPSPIRPEQAPEIEALCRKTHNTFRKIWGFPLPTLVLEEDLELAPLHWIVRVSGNEVHRATINPHEKTLDRILADLLTIGWKLFTYNRFRTYLQEVEELQPFLIQEVKNRLDLLKTWQALRQILKNGGSLKNFTSKLERLLAEGRCDSPDWMLTPSMLAALWQT